MESAIIKEQTGQKPKKAGVFITFEGCDGCGKTTQMNLLNKYLKEKKYNTITTLEPGGSDIGKKLREILLHYEGYVADICESFLYLADRAQHCKTVIQKSMDEGKIVLCDRFCDSTLAYQGCARGIDTSELEFLNRIATDNLEPNLTLLFDADIETLEKRLGSTKDRLEKEGAEFYKKVKEGYLQLAKKYPQRIKVINANQEIEAVFEDVKKAVDKIL